MSTDKSTFGSRLRSERVGLNKNQHEFGVIGGVSGKSQGYYERDERRPDSDYLSRISRHVDVAYLLTGTKMDNVADKNFVREPSAEYATQRNTYSSKVALEAADKLQSYGSIFEIPDARRLQCYELIYMSLYMQEFADQEPVFLDEAVKVMAQSGKTA